LGRFKFQAHPEPSGSKRASGHYIKGESFEVPQCRLQVKQIPSWTTSKKPSIFFKEPKRSLPPEVSEPRKSKGIGARGEKSVTLHGHLDVRSWHPAVHGKHDARDADEGKLPWTVLPGRGGGQKSADSVERGKATALGKEDHMEAEKKTAWRVKRNRKVGRDKKHQNTCVLCGEVRKNQSPGENEKEKAPGTAVKKTARGNSRSSNKPAVEVHIFGRLRREKQSTKAAEKGVPTGKGSMFAVRGKKKPGAQGTIPATFFHIPSPDRQGKIKPRVSRRLITGLWPCSRTTIRGNKAKRRKRGLVNHFPWQRMLTDQTSTRKLLTQAKSGAANLPYLYEPSLQEKLSPLKKEKIAEQIN